MEWQKLPVPLSELCLASVLRCGQSFRWKSSGSGEWSCALRGRILTLRQDRTHLHYRAIFPQSPKKDPDTPDGTAELIRDYFNLSVDLTELYKKWSSRDPHFEKMAPRFTGIRMLRQDPWENLVSFICSSNNNISRISQMVENLCINFGPEIGQIDGMIYYDFPAPSALISAGIEERLRALGFGYRAKYIHQTAQMIVNDHPVGWLDGLRDVKYKDAHEALLQLQGVGPKVADCVCLMSLDKTEAVPVDTHVWQIAMRDYKFGKGKHKSLTKATYTAIGDHFRELWGDEAGWAHSVLFTADLKSFAEVEVKVEKFINPQTTIAMKEGKKTKPKSGVKDEGEDNVKQEIGVTTEVAQPEKPVFVFGNEGNVTRGTGTATRTTKREKRERKAKVGAKKVSDVGGNQVDSKPIITAKRGRTVKVELKNRNRDGEDPRGVRVKLEEVVEETLVKEDRDLKRSSIFEDEEMGDVSMTMADRIKRRRRR